jgi:hypothetical protein
VMAPSPKGLTRETPQGRTEVGALLTSCSPYVQRTGLGTLKVAHSWYELGAVCEAQVNDCISAMSGT